MSIKIAKEKLKWLTLIVNVNNVHVIREVLIEKHTSLVMIETWTAAPESKVQQMLLPSFSNSFIYWLC